MNSEVGNMLSIFITHFITQIHQVFWQLQLKHALHLLA